MNFEHKSRKHWIRGTRVSYIRIRSRREKGHRKRTRLHWLQCSHWAVMWCDVAVFLVHLILVIISRFGLYTPVEWSAWTPSFRYTQPNFSKIWSFTCQKISQVRRHVLQCMVGSVKHSSLSEKFRILMCANGHPRVAISKARGIKRNRTR